MYCDQAKFFWFVTFSLSDCSYIRLDFVGVTNFFSVLLPNIGYIPFGNFESDYLFLTKTNLVFGRISGQPIRVVLDSVPFVFLAEQYMVGCIFRNMPCYFLLLSSYESAWQCA